MTSVDKERDKEPALIRRSLQQDAEAFEALMRHYQQRIFLLAYRMTGVATDAEDIVQEVFVYAYQHLHEFREGSSFAAWLYRIATNDCLDWLKRRERRDRAYRGWLEDRSTTASAVGEMAARAHEALLRLPPKQRAALVLTACEGFNHAEAAQTLGCSETTISWRVFMARKQMQRLLRNTE